MKIGLIGLGKMGGNMTKRLLQGDHHVVAFDPNEAARVDAAASGAQAVDSREGLVTSLDQQIIWLMIPSQFVDDEINKLLALVSPGAIIIDGGNSDYRLSRQRAQLCQERDVRFIDVGTSGGILGLEHGYSMMVGGDNEAVNTIAPVLDTLAPPNGWHHFGESGSGHYVKMVHNAIEYGLMEAYAEGYRILKDGPYEHIDLAAAGKVWQQGSIIESLLNGLTAEVLSDNPNLEGIDGFVHESGEAKWALEVAEEHNIETPSITASFDVRIRSQTGETNFTTKLLAAMRNKFGGHTINKGSDE